MSTMKKLRVIDAEVKSLKRKLIEAEEERLHSLTQAVIATPGEVKERLAIVGACRVYGIPVPGWMIKDLQAELERLYGV